MATATDPKTNDAPEGFIEKFTVLKSAPRELWLVYFGKVAETCAYSLVNASLMLYLINELGYSDEGAGGLVGVWATIIALFTFLVGSLSDAIGIRKTLIFAFALCAITRLMMAVVGHPVLTPILGLMPMTLGVAMTIPVMVAAARRFTNSKQRSMGFALLYVFMNVGFLIGGKLYDWVRNWMGEDGTMSVLGLDLSVYETIFLIATVFTLVGLIPVWGTMRKGVEATDEGTKIDPANEGEIEVGGSMWVFIGRAVARTGRILTEVGKEKAFYRFLLLVALIVGVRMVFYHMHYTLPVWADREMGYGSRFGTAWGVINPALIIILTPIVGALAQKISSYTMLVIGTSISAVTVFLLVLPPDTFAALTTTWFGEVLRQPWLLDIDGDLSPIYMNLVLFSIFFSIGEAIWSPRLYEYTAACAPKGRESTYMSMSLLPMFVAKLTVGPLAGVLLDAYCPMEGARSSWVLWLVVGGMAIFSPLAIFFLRGVITARSAEKEEAAS